jgi:hypothetical protein
MSIYGISTAPFAGTYSSLPYEKAEQNGCQNCLLSLCKKIIELTCTLFKAIFSCCCEQEKNEEDSEEDSLSGILPSPLFRKITPPSTTNPTLAPIVPKPTEQGGVKTSQQPIPNSLPLTPVASSSTPQVLPFAHTVFQMVAGFLEIADMVACEKTCRGWYTFSKMADLNTCWENLSIRAGIPLIDGQNRNRRTDLQALYPITLSGKSISCLGDIVEKTPCVSAKILTLLGRPDPFEMTKTMRENYLLVVVVSKVQRTAYKASFPFFLNEDQILQRGDGMAERGNNLMGTYLESVDGDFTSYVDGKELLIPLSLRNLKTLCSILAKVWRARAPVLEGNLDLNPTIFEQRTACSEKIRVWFMRKRPVRHGRGTSFDAQIKSLNSFGFQSMSFKDRVYANCLFKMKSETYLDGDIPSRFCDTISLNNTTYHSTIYVSRDLHDKEILKFNDLCDTYFDHGVVPCVSAEI